MECGKRHGNKEYDHVQEQDWGAGEGVVGVWQQEWEREQEREREREQEQAQEQEPRQEQEQR